ncbi:ATP-binding cassette domain-containing protein [Methylobacterium oryzae CBMB20]
MRLTAAGREPHRRPRALRTAASSWPPPEAEMRRVRGDSIAMIFQEPMTSLNPVLTIGFQIAEALIRHRGLSRSAAEAEALRLLDKVRIPAARSRLHEYPHRFSGGMRQRGDDRHGARLPSQKLLIADEPTTALDVTDPGPDPRP